MSEINFKRMYNLINYNIPTSVTILSLSQNKLTSIPLSKIANYNGLIDLYLCNNKFTTLPSFPDSIVTITVSNNPINCLPIINSKNIIGIDASNTNVTCLPINSQLFSQLSTFYWII